MIIIMMNTTTTNNTTTTTTTNTTNQSNNDNDYHTLLLLLRVQVRSRPPRPPRMLLWLPVLEDNDSSQTRRMEWYFPSGFRCIIR